MSKTKLKKRRIPTSLLIIAFGIILVSIPFAWKVNQADLSFNRSPEITIQKIDSVKGQKPLSLIIAKTNTNLTIEEGKINNGKWEVSKNGASHFVSSAFPGGGGNIVIYGHNKEKIFGSLEFLKPGDEISITTIDSIEHKYKISKIQTVSPDQIEVLNPTTKEVLTIYTCTGLFDTKRLVVKADPV